MNKVKEALTRKLGPFPAWVWLVLFAALYYYYEKRKSTSSVTGTGTGSVAPAATTPQAPLLVPSGDQVYDPNTGALLGGDPTGSGGNGNPSTDPGSTPGPITGPAGPPGAPGANGDNAPAPTPTNTPTPASPLQQATKPASSKQGNAHLTKQARARTKATLVKDRSRGNLVGGARFAGRPEPSGKAPSGKKSKVTSRIKTPFSNTTIKARAASTHPQPSNKPAPAPAPRPSSPAPRAIRQISVAQAAPKPVAHASAARAAKPPTPPRKRK